MLRWRELGFAGAALLVVLGVGTVGAQDKAAVVKQRQDTMKSLWPTYYGPLSNAAKGDAAAMTAAPDKAQQAVEAVRRVATLFPQGTGRDAAPETRATPAVWSERAAFEAAFSKLADETAKLGEVAKSGNLDAYKAQFGKVGEACGGCHGGPPKSGGKFRFEAS